MTEELNKSVETALKAFDELKGMVTGFDKKLTDMTPKMDAFDAATFDKLQKAGRLRHSGNFGTMLSPIARPKR